MRTAANIIAQAGRIAATQRYTGDLLDTLNSILSDLCETHDLALARGVFNFNFNPSLTSLFGSGPYPLPLDYLRTSGSSGAKGWTKSVWYLYPAPTFPSGQPLFLTPIDLAEFDLYPQLPSQSTPELWATDMGGPLTQRIVLSTTCALTSGSTTATPATLVAIAGGPQVVVSGLAMAGEGIKPGTTITIAGAGPTITLSQAATATLSAASVFFGIAPVAYVYPAPLSNYPVTCRYQRKMPPITDTSQIPWFPNEGYLIKELAGRMMDESDDTRAPTHLKMAKEMLGEYLDLVDDKTNRAQEIQLDPRRYGHAAGYNRLKNTKLAGW